MDQITCAHNAKRGRYEALQSLAGCEATSRTDHDGANRPPEAPENLSAVPSAQGALQEEGTLINGIIDDPSSLMLYTDARQRARNVTRHRCDPGRRTGRSSIPHA